MTTYKARNESVPYIGPVWVAYRIGEKPQEGIWEQADFEANSISEAKRKIRQLGTKAAIICKKGFIGKVLIEYHDMPDQPYNGFVAKRGPQRGIINGIEVELNL